MNATSLNQSDCPEVKVPIPLFFTMGVVSLAENLLVVVAIVWNRNLHSPMYCFICSLAAFNTIASVTKTWENLMIVFADVGHLRKTGSPELKLDDVMDSLLCMSFVGSIFSFLAIAADRYERLRVQETLMHSGVFHTIVLTCKVISTKDTDQKNLYFKDLVIPQKAFSERKMASVSVKPNHVNHSVDCENREDSDLCCFALLSWPFVGHMSNYPLQKFKFMALTGTLERIQQTADNSRLSGLTAHNPPNSQFIVDKIISSVP